MIALASALLGFVGCRPDSEVPKADVALPKQAPVRTITSPDDILVELESLPEPARQRVALLHAGMTRREVEQHFEQEGGISTQFEQRYFIRNLPVGGKFVMVELTFQPADMPDATFANRKLASGVPAPEARDWFDQHRPAWSDRGGDILRGISEPFLANPATDEETFTK